MISDLMPFKAWFMLVTWLPDVDRNFLELSLLIGIIIYLCEGPLVVILMRGLESVLELFTVLWICLIFLSNSLGKFSLSLRISQTLKVDKTCVYKHIGLEGLLKELLLDGFFPLFFAEESPLDKLTELSGGEILENSTGLAGRRRVDFLLDGVIGILMVNSSLILLWNVFCPSPTSKLFHPPLKIEETSSNTTLPKPVKHGISSFLWFLRWWLEMKSDICSRETLMLLTSISWVPSFLKRDMRWVWSFQELILASCSSLYKSTGENKLLIACSGPVVVLKSTYVVGMLRFKVTWAWVLLSLSTWEKVGMWNILLSIWFVQFRSSLCIFIQWE